MAVAITGGTGYLGSRLAQALVQAGTQVVVIGRRSTQRMARKEVRCVFRAWDDIHVLEGIEQVVHAAACYGRHGESEEEMQAANVDLPLGLLERASAAGVRRWITIGTALPPDLSIYALTKHRFLTLAEAVPHRLEHSWLACEHFYGPGDDPSKFIARCIQAFLRGDDSLPLTDGSQQRDFLHVDDVVGAIRHILALPSQGGHHRFPLGTGRSVSIRELVHVLHRLTGATTRLEFGTVPRRAGEPEVCVADPEPLAALGWRSTIALEDGLASTIQAERSVYP